MKAPALIMAILLLPLAHPLFLVGPVKDGAAQVLCENHSEAFVCGPSGKTERLTLDGNFQAQFAPDMPGPYTVQCGEEVSVVSFAAQAEAASVEPEWAEAASFFLLLSSLALIALMAIAAFFIAKTYLFGGMRFCKIVSGKKAELVLRAEKGMLSVVIEDPICLGWGKGGISIPIPSLKPGSQWRHEYDFPEGRHALPAELVATVEGKKIRVLSELYVEGGTGAASPKEKAPFSGSGKKAMRRISRAA